MNGRKTTKPPSGGLSLNDRFAKKIWSGGRGSHPRPRPWQVRALPLSYTRIREVGGDHAPATGRAMPNAHRECNSLRVVFEPAQSPDIGAIAGQISPKRPANGRRPHRRGYREPWRPAD